MPRSASPSTPTIAPGRRIQTRRSGVHGKGVFAVQDIAEGEVLVEYTGEVVGWQEAQDRHPHDPLQPNHTFYFHVDEDHVIDAKFGGNSSRWINHSCNPNCYADEQDHRIFITALRNIQAGEELNYDYGLIIEERYTKKLKAEYPCWCGSKNCRGTLLAPKRGWAPPVPLPPSQAAAQLKKATKKAETPKAKTKPLTKALTKPLTKPKTKAKASVKAADKPVSKSKTAKVSDKKAAKTGKPSAQRGRSQ